jgi:hypothetical protein
MKGAIIERKDENRVMYGRVGLQRISTDWTPIGRCFCAKELLNFVELCWGEGMLGQHYH